MRPLFKMHAELCQALANEHRLAIMYELKDGEKCVSDLAESLGISVHNVSQHLRVLRERLLVQQRKEGQTVYYSIANPKFLQACALIRQGLLEQHQAEGTALHAAAGVFDPVAALFGGSGEAAETAPADASAAEDVPADAAPTARVSAAAAPAAGSPDEKH